MLIAIALHLCRSYLRPELMERWYNLQTSIGQRVARPPPVELIASGLKSSGTTCRPVLGSELTRPSPAELPVPEPMEQRYNLRTVLDSELTRRPARVPGFELMPAEERPKWLGFKGRLRHARNVCCSCMGNCGEGSTIPDWPMLMSQLAYRAIHGRGGPTTPRWRDYSTS